MFIENRDPQFKPALEAGTAAEGISKMLETSTVAAPVNSSIAVFNITTTSCYGAAGMLTPTALSFSTTYALLAALPFSASHS